MKVASVLCTIMKADELEINSFLMSAIAALGFLFHGAAAWVLYKGRKASINVYAVFLHSFFDIISTISTFIAGVLIYLTGWGYYRYFIEHVNCFIRFIHRY